MDHTMNKTTFNTLPESENKETLRMLYKQKRLSLSTQEIKEKSEKIRDNFINFLSKQIQVQEWLNIACYFPSNKEVDTRYIISKLLKKNMNVLMPKIQWNILLFNQYKKESIIVRNKKYKSIKEIQADTYITPDIIIAPLVAFDKKLNRIWMWWGFYDRTIEKIEKEKTILFVAIAYEIQKHENIQSEIHDKKPDIIITEDRTYSPKFTL